MSEESLYTELGLSRDAGPEEIRRAFRFIAPAWERTLLAPEQEKQRFKRLAYCYIVLSNSELRQIYDSNPEELEHEEKFDLAFDLALRGYDEEMLAEYLRRLSFPDDTVAMLGDSVQKVRVALDRQEAQPEEQSREVFCRTVPAKNGWRWLVSGFSLFRKSPLIWTALSVILIGMVFFFSLIPVAGELIFNILFPVFLSGLWSGCRTLEQGEELELAHLFSGFHQYTSRLVAIGGVNLLGQILLIALMVLMGGDVIYKMFVLKNDLDQAQLISAAPGIMLAITVGMLLSIPLLMLVWFAPMLVIFKQMEVKEAMRMSFFACLKNTVPFVVYSALAMFFAFFAILLTFGLGFLLLFPLVITSTYASYKDIFEGSDSIV